MIDRNRRRPDEGHMSRAMSERATHATHRQAAPKSSPKSSPPYFIFSLIVLLLVCDTATKRQVSALESEQTEPDEAADRPKFAASPEDSMALLGQSAEFACALENKRASLYWLKDNKLTIGVDGDVISLFRGRGYSILQTLADGRRLNLSETDGDKSSLQVSAGAASSTSNYTMRIENVSLWDEANFTCRVAGVLSAPGRLTVLLAPSQLSISADSPVDELDESPKLASAADSDSSQSSADDVRVLKVRQNSRLRLDCRSDLAKPHAELVWLDDQQRRVPKYSMEESAGQNSSEFSSELVSADGVEPRLSSTSLIWTLQVQRHHNNQLLTCLAKHAAFEQRAHFPQLYGRELRRQVRLDVQFEPEVELKVEPKVMLEHQAARFECLAHAKPNQLTYRWYLDEQLIANATEGELHVPLVTRQLHSRRLRCEVSNEIGTTSRELQLNVRYAPSIVSHLMPASLPSQDSESLDALQPAAQKLTGARGPTAGEVALARHLAVGFSERQDVVRLRCDFDANPKPTHVEWFKLTNDYTILRDVSPSAADELIAEGGTHAIFRDTPSGRAAPENEERRPRLDAKRHTSASQHASEGPSSQPESGNIVDTLDLEQMSLDLLAELNFYLRSGNDTQPANQSQRSPLDAIIPEPMSHSSVTIREPLAWSLVGAHEANQLSDVPHHRPMHRLPPSRGPAQRSPSLVLRRPAEARVAQRQTTVSSSTIAIRSPNEDSIGLYICRARQVAGADQEPRVAWAARGVYVVKRQRPRIVSSQHQEAPFGSRVLQVECLAQINTVVDNVTTISWSKDGKLIEPSARQRGNQAASASSQREKSYAIIEERSPDLLFMRSKLRIFNGDIHDFGIYNCTIQNSIGIADTIPIKFEAIQSTGGAFYYLTLATVGAVVLLSVVVACFVASVPPQKTLGKLERAAPKGEPDQQAAALKSKALDALDSDRKSPRSSDSGHEEGGSVCDKSKDSSIHDSGEFLHQQSPYLANGVASHESPYTSQRIRRHQQHAPAASQQRSSKFAAIHESLEHKLQLGPNGIQASAQRPANGGATANRQSISGDVSANEGARPIIGTDSPSAPTETDKSLLDRLWSRILANKRPNGERQAHQTRPRPTISGPMGSLNRPQSVANGAAVGPKLSTSLSRLDSPGAARQQAQLAETGANSGHHSTRNLIVSSRANLIQDSTTSDGTGSSGRSSSNSNLNLSRAQPQQLYAGDYAPPPLDYMQPPPGSLWVQPQDPQLSCPIGSPTVGYYINHNAISNVAYQSDQMIGSSVGGLEPQLYSPVANQLVSPYTSSALNGRFEVDQSIEHYQMPMMANVEFQQSQVNPATCYATVCNRSPNNVIMGAPSGGIPFAVDPSKMVPTSDSGDAYFESNYGTMLSRSSAYKTLGYHLHGEGSASSTPNSMTTHANNSTNGNELHQPHHLGNNRTNISPAMNTQVTTGGHLLSDQVAIVQSDGSSTNTTMAKNLSDNGLATHV